MQKKANPIIRVLATGFFTGMIGRGGGTVASLCACGIWAALSGSRLYPLLPVVFIIVGWIIAGYAERYIFKKKDAPEIVIDEFAGMLLGMVSFRFSLDMPGFVYLALGFTFFRIFDIFKPPPVSLVQKIPGGAGIMADDILAAVMTNIVLQLVRRFIFH